jgi:hypothetical protein
MFRHFHYGGIDPEDLAALQRVFDRLSAELPAGTCAPEDLAAAIISKFQAGSRDESALLAETRATYI